MKKTNEEVSAPTNSMGTSSSTQGPVQTYDPLMKRRKVLRRIKMIVKKKNEPNPS